MGSFHDSETAINLAPVTDAQEVDEICGDIKVIGDAVVADPETKRRAALQPLVRIARQPYRDFVDLALDSLSHAGRQSEVCGIEIPRENLLRGQHV